MTLAPLAGLLVVGMAGGPARGSVVAWRILRDLGARVAALYPPARPGDPLLAGVDVQTEPSAIGSLIAELDGAGLLVTDRAGLDWLSARGLDRDGLEARWPGLVVACISPFGLSGPWAGLAGGETIVEAAAGVLMSNGTDDDPPLRAGIPVAAMGGGLLGAAAAIAALYERAHSGLGQFIDHAEYDSMIAFSGTLLPTYFLTGKAGDRLGNRHGMAAPWNVYPTRDSWLIICTMNDAQFQALAWAIGRPDLLDDPRYRNASLRVQHVAALDEAVTGWSRTRETRDALRLLLDSGIAAGPIQTLDQVLRDPQARYRGVVPPGPASASGPFLHFARRPQRPAAGSPAEPRSPGTAPAPPATAGPHPGRRPAAGPLAGVRVVEVSGHTAGPLAGRLLALLGAEVVKVEPPSGEAARHVAQQIAGQGYLFHVNNTDKRDITLDVFSQQGRAALDALLGSADVFLTNLAPGTLAASALGPDDLCGKRPSLVYSSLSGFGTDGPRGGEKTFDMVIQALSGVMALTVNPEGQPCKIAMSVADLFGACSAALGTTAALLERTFSGKGCYVDATLFDVTVWSTQESWHGPSSPGTCLRTADGWVAVEGDLGLLAGALPAADAKAVAGLFGTLTSEQCQALCAGAGLAALRPRRIDEVAEAEQTASRGMIVDVEYAGRPMRVIGSPFHFSRTPSAVRAAAPELGADNQELLTRLAGSRPGERGPATHSRRETDKPGNRQAK
jgi:crotonobetainyl-CoA:carnitine CoA-transferase CaiB-like acyl-CoA transferase